jgi:hypothetical protein
LAFFPDFFAAFFIARFLAAPFVFLFATALAISPVVMGVLSDASRESSETEFFAMILSQDCIAIPTADLICSQTAFHSITSSERSAARRRNVDKGLCPAVADRWRSFYDQSRLGERIARLDTNLPFSRTMWLVICGHVIAA